MDQSNAAMSGVWSASRGLLIAVGGALVSGGFISKTSLTYQLIMLGAGAVMVVGPAGYNLYTAVTRYIHERQMVAKAVGAGINLVVQGKAMAADGTTVIGRVGAGAYTTPPLPVTQQSAAAIVKEFAPTEPAKAR